MKTVGHFVAFVALTAISLFGGVAWIVAAITTKGWRRPALAIALYGLATAATIWAAPFAGRQVTGCWGIGKVEAASPIYCLLNRSYVTPELAAVLDDLADHMAQTHPDLRVTSLDGSFPFTNMPLLPHLSHDDGEKMDLAFFYLESEDGTPTDRQRSPLGYFAFEDGPTDCPDVTLTLRWDLRWLQPVFPDLKLDEDRMRRAMRQLIEDDRVSKVFLEPHLQRTLDVEAPKVRFQGCRAARHDDHIHMQL